MPDNLTPEQRRRCMSRVRVKDTDIELLLRKELHRRGLRYRKHMKALPGTPDIVFTRAKVAVFVDGDFWHGYHFHEWKDSLSPFWQEKIAKNRQRDLKTFLQLRAMGWQVLRVWQHNIRSDADGTAQRIERCMKKRLSVARFSEEGNTD